MGLAMARELKANYPKSKIIVLEKESQVAAHASGRNSGVIHAGFYYSPDSLKAKLTRKGNLLLHEFCDAFDVPVLPCGKLVVARNEAEDLVLDTLFTRGQANGVPVELIDSEQVKEIEPRAKTFRRALWSPSTSSVDPVAVCQCLLDQLKSSGVQVRLSEGVQVISRTGEIETTKGSRISAGFVYNCAGLYADRMAQQMGFGDKYQILPFKGIYLKPAEMASPLKTHVYPVPNLKNPFLGVHFTLTVQGEVKIGPTAIPAFWRENYQGFDNFNFSELGQVGRLEATMFLKNTGGFRTLALSEMKKYRMEYLQDLAGELVSGIDLKKFSQWTRPGIRAQLVEKKTLSLVQDFVVERDEKSLHFLNAVSPAFTSAFAMVKEALP